jgi:hypothetical protein
MGWIDDFMDSTKELESPRSFFYWAAMSAVSAVVMKNVFIQRRKDMRLYPNTFILTIAKSGMRKGVPVNAAKELVHLVGTTRVLSGRNSIQGLIKELAHTSTRPGGGAPITHSSGFLASGELATFLIEDPQAFPILTDLYDTHYHEREWKNTLKGTGVERLEGPCLTMLGASNQALFKEAVPPSSYSGGFIGRTLLIVEERRHTKNALIDPEGDAEIPGVVDFVDYLRFLSSLRGPFTWNESAKARYKEWYATFEPESMDDRTGTADRISDHILKVAMLESLANRGDMVLSLDDVERGLEAVLTSTSNVDRVVGGIGKSEIGEGVKIVVDELAGRPGYTITRRKLLELHYKDFDSLVLDRIVETGIQSGFFAQTMPGGHITYTLQTKWANVMDEIRRRRESIGKAQKG